MATRRVTVADVDGLHARPAALFVKAVAATGMPIRIGKVGAEAGVDARSILAVLALDVRHGDEVELSTDADGGDAALDRLAAVLEGADADALPQ